MEGAITAQIVEEEYPIFTMLSKTNDEILRFENNGDIFVHGKLVENDKQVV